MVIIVEINNDESSSDGEAVYDMGGIAESMIVEERSGQEPQNVDMTVIQEAVDFNQRFDYRMTENFNNQSALTSQVSSFSMADPLNHHV